MTFFGLGMLGCSERETQWELTYVPDALESQASSVLVEIRSGSCTGPSVFRSDLASGAASPVLEPGSYGFFARASDSSCRWFASGCEERTLPLDEAERIAVTLTAEPEADRCPGACDQGRCTNENDGSTDGMNPPGERRGIEVAAGRAHSCARVRSTDEVYCWGLNETLQLGAITNAVEQTTPVRVEGLSGAVAIAVGGNGQPKDGHSCAIVAGGGVRCWGDNLVGQHGTGSAGAPRAEPQMAMIQNARGIDGGRQHTCVLTTDSEVFCWGANERAQTGATANQGIATPHEVSAGGSLMRIATGNDHSCVSSGGGDVRCWGSNGNAQLGRDTPNSSEDPVTVQGLSNVASIALGEGYSCAVEMSGEVLCWGRNSNGVLGDPSFSGGASPQRVDLPERPVAEVAAGSDFACARFSAGDIYCWGSNQWGALGRGVDSSRSVSTPGPVLGIDNASDISAGDNHVCAVTTDGRVRCWGRGQQGRLGNGDLEDKYEPTDVVGFGPQ